MSFIKMSSTNIKVIAFDLDGTLLESNHIKDEAFDTIFSEWPEHREIILKWHFSHNHIDRREKFRYFVEEVLTLPEQDKLIEVLTDRFSKLTTQAIIDCSFVEGALSFLEYIQGKVATYLISATPQKELNKILFARKLKNYFNEVYGAPINKEEVLKTIMTNEKMSPNKVLYIGDSPEDLQAAEVLDIQFIGRKSDRPLDGKSHKIFSDFIQLKKYTLDYYDLS